MGDTENFFPKLDGYHLYASEVNAFYGAIHSIDFNNTADATASATYAILHTYRLSGTTINFDRMKLEFDGAFVAAGVNQGGFLAIFVSGTQITGNEINTAESYNNMGGAAGTQTPGPIHGSVVLISGSHFTKGVPVSVTIQGKTNGAGTTYLNKSQLSAWVI